MGGTIGTAADGGFCCGEVREVGGTDTATPTDDLSLVEPPSPTSSENIWEVPLQAPCRWDVFISHAKDAEDSARTAGWVAEVCEAEGLKAFLDHSSSSAMTGCGIPWLEPPPSEHRLQRAIADSRCMVVVLDAETFNSTGVAREFEWARENRVPIIPVYECELYDWEDFLRQREYFPYVFLKQRVVLTMNQQQSRSRLLGVMASGGLERARRVPALDLSRVRRKKYSGPMNNREEALGLDRKRENASAS